MSEQRQYVIAVADHHIAIGPFASEADAKTYLEQSDKDQAIPILRVMPPVDPPDQDADLHP